MPALHAPPAQAGFTLIEVMVAVVLLGVFALTSFRALDAVLAAERHARAESQRWQALARVFHRVEADLIDAVPPATPPQAGRAGFVVEPGPAGGLELAFERQRPEDLGFGLVEVRYRFAEGRLTRVERLPAREPDAETLLEGIERFGPRFMDASGTWRDEWPPERAGTLPRALQWNLTLADGIELTRIWRLQ